MQNIETLIKLGFRHYPDWDNKETGTENYRIEINGTIIRAVEWGASHGYPNEKTFISAGIVRNGKGVVDRWRDFCSEGSISRFINSITH